MIVIVKEIKDLNDIKDLRDAIYTKDDKELVNFIKENFTYCKGKENEDYRKQIDNLKKLDDDTRNFAISRMIQIEEEKDISKLLAPFITFALAIITSFLAYTAAIKDFNSSLNNLGLASTLLIFSGVTFRVIDSRSYRKNVVAFKSLLENCKRNNGY